MTAMADAPIPLALQSARRGRGWDVGTLAREADVGADLVARAELGERVPADAMTAMMRAVGLDAGGSRLPTRPVDDAHAGRLGRIVAVAAREGGIVAVPDVEALSAAVGWSWNDEAALSRRVGRWETSAKVGCAASIASIPTLGALALWMPSGLLGSLGGLGLVAAVATYLASGLAYVWKPGPDSGRLVELRLASRLRGWLGAVGYVVSGDVLTVIDVGDGQVTRFEYHRPDVLGVSVRPEAPGHVSVAVRTPHGTADLRWLASDDPVVRVLASWGADRA